jgi:ferritin
MIGKKLQKAFSDQINAELYSAYLYLAMAADFEEKNWLGAGKWMRLQAQEEVGHAMKLMGHVIERGGRVELGAIDKPAGAWDSYLAAFEAAYAHEQEVTSLIYALVDKAAAEKDKAAEIFLQWFVTEQVEEEAHADQIVQALRLIAGQPQGLFMLDAKLGARGAGD